MRSFRGATLIELMISLLIGSILSISCIQLFITVKQIFIKQQGLAHIQENARVMNTLLGKEIHTAGSIGCSAFQDDIILSIHPEIESTYYGLKPFVPLMGISVEDIKNNPLSPKTLKDRIIQDSDVIWIKTVKFKNKLFKPDEVIAVSDCSQVDFLKLTHKLDESILSKKYPENKFIGALTSRIFYIGDTGRKNTKNQPVFALYSTDLNHRTMELAEGVEKLKILYKTLDNNYIPFDKVRDWDKVSRVKVSILLSSIEDNIKTWWTYEWSIKRKEAF